MPKALDQNEVTRVERMQSYSPFLRPQRALIQPQCTGAALPRSCAHLTQGDVWHITDITDFPHQQNVLRCADPLDDLGRGGPAGGTLVPALFSVIGARAGVSLLVAWSAAVVCGDHE